MALNRSRNLLLPCLLFAGQFTCTSGNAADTDAPPFARSPKALYAAASTTTVPDGTDVSVMELDEAYRFAADGSYLYTRHEVYRVLTQTGADGWNELASDWSPWRDQRPVLKARVVLADGKEYVLDQGTLADSPATQSDGNVYGDERTLRAPLPAIAPGAVVETEVETRSAPVLPGAGEVIRSYVQLSVPLQAYRLTIAAPASLPLHVRQDLLPDLRPIRRETAAGIEWMFEVGPQPGYDDTIPSLPRDTYAFPAITFSTGNSWQSVAQAYATVVDARIAQSDVAAVAERLARDQPERDAKISALIAFLNREIRYTGVEFDKASVLPHPPAETLRHKYGDCKDKATLLVGMLRAIGIQAFVALLDVGDRVDQPDDQPGMGLFDHAIVFVPGEPGLWIDPTDESARLRQLPTSDAGRLALVVAPDSTGLARTPMARAADNIIYEERRVVFANQGPAQITETSLPRGTAESRYRRQFADLSSKKTRDALTDYFKNEYSADHVEHLEHSDPRDFGQPFTLTLAGAKARRGYTRLFDAKAYIPLSGLFSELPAEMKTREPTDADNAKATRPHARRIADYEIESPVIVEWHYSFIAPDGFEPVSLPADQSIAVGPARLTEQFSVDAGNVIHAVLQLDTGKQRYTATELAAFRDKAAELVASDSIAIKFELTPHLLATRGKAREAFQAYRDLVARHPKDAISHLRRAQALLGAGMGEAARLEARTATQLDTHSAFAQEQLAVILKHDLIGRSHGPGADYAGAASAYRAAIALDPTDKSLIGELGVLLEYDERGLRYSRHADLQGAIAAYRQLTAAERVQLEIPNNLAFALFYARQFTAARQVLGELASPPLALIAACDAELDGVPKAIEEIRRRAGNDSSYLSTLQTAGNMLMNMGEYAKAADLIDAGASGANTARLLSLAATLRHTVPYRFTPQADTPEDFVRQALAVTGGPGLTIERWQALQSRNSLEASRGQTDEEREAVLASSRNAERMAIDNGLAPETALDIGLQTVRVKASGTDATGYRAVTQAPGMSNATFYVVREASGYRLLGSPEWPASAGLEALDRAQRNDLAGARALLDWVREDTKADTSEDPYAAGAFPRLWQAGGGDAEPWRYRVAAAALLTGSAHTAARGVQLLEDALHQDLGDTDVENIQLALLNGYSLLNNHAAAATAAGFLASRAPRSASLFATRIRQLSDLQRYAEAQELVRSRLQELPDDLVARRAAVRIQSAQRNYEAAYRLELDVVTNPKSGASDLNQLGWLSLFFDRPEGPDLDSAQRAAQLADHSTSILHTLGCVYAEAGRTKEARDVLLHAMELDSLVEPTGPYWYAFGRIAEQYGERDIALADYAKVSLSASRADSMDSSYQLAQRRIALLK